jgi:putative ABC transport system permease protein
MIDALMQDVKYGVRLLLKSPAFSAVAVLTLALGIGANTAIFSVINGMLLRPLVYEDGDKLMFISEWSQQVPDMSFSVENFKDLRDQNKVFEAITAYRSEAYVLTGGDRAERISGREVTSGLFATLRLHPILGRVFTPEDDKVGAAPVAMLSEGFWTRHFGRDPNVIGRKLLLSGQPFTVVGILPGTVHAGMRLNDVFTTLLRREDVLGGELNRGNHPGIYVYARRKPGVTAEQASADVVRIGKHLADTYPNSNAGQSMNARGLHEVLVEDVRGPSLLLLGTVGFVLLIACANVANLLLGRTAARRRELAVRAALGAARSRIIAQLLTESVLLSGLGAALGLLLAYWAVPALVAMLPANTAQSELVSINGTVLAFTAAVALFSGVVFGMAPAWHASSPNMNETLKEGGRSGSPGAGHHRLRNALVVTETALALVLLVGTGLMLKSFLRVTHADPGFDASGVLTAAVSGPDIKYKEKPQVRAFVQEIVANVEALPGVESAAAITPLLGGWQSSFSVEGEPPSAPGQQPSADIGRITPNYFRVMGIQLVRGRFFEDRDGPDATPVCVVDETFVKAHWPNQDPIGKRVRFGDGRHDPKDTRPPEPWMEVVGVVRHVKLYGVDQDSRVEMYLPVAQSPQNSFSLVVRTRGNPLNVASGLRGAVQSVDADVPVARVRTLESIIAERVAQRRLATLLISFFGGLAMLLGAVGIYGVTSYGVTQRTYEMGIRMALGAQKRDIFRLVIGNTMIVVAAGMIGGLIAAFGLSRLMATILFQVSPSDPPTYFASPLLLALVALAAIYLPARRATRVDPMIALRYE